MAAVSSREYIASSAYGRFGGYLENQHFFGTLLLAIFLHLGGIALYQIVPKEIVELVPVRVLNIKIGQPVVGEPMPQQDKAGQGGNDEEDRSTRDMHVPAKPKPAPVAEKKAPPKPVKAAPKPQPVKKQHAAAVIKPAVKPKAEIRRNAAVKPQPKIPAATKGVSIAEEALTRKAEEALTAKQYVREDAIPAERYQPTSHDENGKAGKGSGTGSAIGNSNLGDAEIESRYTQTLSLWLNRFKIYPAEARSEGIGGTVMLRIRINRQGRIMRYYLERSSGHDMIDRAITTMVNAANPVPAVPPNYPDPRPYLEFLVPIHFKP